MASVTWLFNEVACCITFQILCIVWDIIYNCKYMLRVTLFSLGAIPRKYKVILKHNTKLQEKLIINLTLKLLIIIFYSLGAMKVLHTSILH